MPSLHREVERKYALDAASSLPDLTGVIGVEAVEEPADHHLEALYFDTADLALARARTTLRRRTGGQDAGWHLKLPALDDGGGAGGAEAADPARHEVQLPLDGGEREVPAELGRLSWVASRGEPLVPVARLVTERTVRHLLDGAGRAVAEVADDRVTAQRLLDGAEPRSWRELEVELVDGALPARTARALLDDVEARLSALGVQRSASGSKLATALGTAPQPPAAHSAPAAGASAGEVVVAHLAEQVAELVGMDPYVRLDAPDAVHRMRVASRRLRSALQTFRPVLDRARVRAVRGELSWWAGVLGGARDAEVLSERLSSAVRRLDGGDAAAAHVEAVLGEEHRRAHAVVVTTGDGERYRALLAALEALVSDPPFTADAERPARAVLLRQARRAHRELSERVEEALDPGALRGQAHDEALHEARKSAKRARYAAEALLPVWPDAAGYAKAVKRLQTELGEHQDSAVARAALERLAGTPAGRKHAFAFGRLHGLEEARAERVEEPLPQLWEAVADRSARRWMKS